MKKQNKIFAIVSMTLLWASIGHAKYFTPEFSDDGQFIKMAARAFSCGSVLIKPIVAKIGVDEGYTDAYLQVRSVPFSTKYTPHKTLGTAPLMSEGIRTRFGWGTAFKKFSHYRVYCEKVNIARGDKKVITPVKCKDVVTIERVKMNGHCGWSFLPGAAGGEWKPLNMK